MTEQQSTKASEFEPEILQDFLAESESLLDQLEADLRQLAHTSSNISTLDEIGRVLHTLKGNASFLELASIATIVHDAESTLCSARKQNNKFSHTQLGRLRETVDAIRDEIDMFSTNDPAFRAAHQCNARCASNASRESTNETTASSRSCTPSKLNRSLRIETERLDTLSDLVVDLLRENDQLQSIAHANDPAQFARVRHASDTLDRIARSIQCELVRTRMQPIEKLFNKYTRAVQGLSERAGKDIRLVIEGGDTLIDGGVISALSDPITHLVSNACDHGIESREIRTNNAKPTTGTIRLVADQIEQHTRIRVIDDGRGLDPAEIESKAIELGFISIEQRSAHSESEIFRFLLLPGFTTASELNELSGRGVGLDVVRSNIENELAGEIQISSQSGIGTEITLLIPRSLTRSAGVFADELQNGSHGLFSDESNSEGARS